MTNLVDNIKTAFLLPVQVPFDLFLRIPLLYTFPLVVCLLAFTKADLEFCVTIFVKEDAERDNGIAIFLDLVFQFAQLAFGEQ
jgi:hypothetical protein